MVLRGDAYEQPETAGDPPLGFALAAAARKLAKFYAAALEDEPVTPSQLHFLRQLWLEDGLPLVVLRERAQLDATSATWLADQLVKARLVERRRDTRDRRVVQLWLTPAGDALRLRLAPRLAEWEARLRATLAEHHDPATIAAFVSVLETLTRVLPEGDDLWARLSSDWDARLASLRELLEADDRDAGA